jgi:DNA-binding MarR family transcriptional regulator
VSDSRQNVLDSLPHRGDEPHLLREVFRTYQILMAGFARATGMPASRFALMRHLAGADADTGISDLARRLEVNPAAVTRQVQDLEAEGLVLRRADPRDGRRSRVRLSPKGRKQFERIHERTHELEQALAGVLGADEMRRAAVVLTKLRAFVEGRAVRGR